jgi:hypothetical protein
MVETGVEKNFLVPGQEAAPREVARRLVSHQVVGVFQVVRDASESLGVGVHNVYNIVMVGIG